MKFRFLGTGTSVGVPQIGCTCRVCTSPDPRDRRRRCGAYVTASDGAALLVDTPPELRLACIECGVSKVDAVALTHAHMDHVAAFDDIHQAPRQQQADAIRKCTALQTAIVAALSNMNLDALAREQEHQAKTDIFAAVQALLKKQQTALKDATDAKKGEKIVFKVED